MGDWHGIMKISEISHFGKNGALLHREEEIRNTIHSSGEELILGILFSGQPVPSNYYIGLDSRSSISRTQTIRDILQEPTSNSYSRQAIESNNFSVVTVSSGTKQANSPTLLFRATGGSWGPVRNIFMTTGLGYGSNNVLISSVPLSTSITVAEGEIVTMRMAMALSSCQ
jgi:hypothetical protein